MNQRDYELEDLLDLETRKLNIKAEDVSTIKKYTMNNNEYYYSDINRIMRQYPYKKGDICRSYTVKNLKASKEVEAQRQLESLDALIKRSHLPQELIIYRGTSTRFLNATTLRPNGILFLKNTSASLYKHVAKKYLTLSDGLLLEIHLPKNYPALWVAPLSMYYNEAEFILPRYMNLTLVKEEETPSLFHVNCKTLVLKPKDII